jgi:hypothetical protein
MITKLLKDIFRPPVSRNETDSMLLGEPEFTNRTRLTRGPPGGGHGRGRGRGRSPNRGGGNGRGRSSNKGHDKGNFSNAENLGIPLNLSNNNAGSNNGIGGNTNFNNNNSGGGGININNNNAASVGSQTIIVNVKNKG